MQHIARIEPSLLSIATTILKALKMCFVFFAVVEGVLLAAAAPRDALASAEPHYSIYMLLSFAGLGILIPLGVILGVMSMRLKRPACKRFLPTTHTWNAPEYCPRCRARLDDADRGDS